VVALLKSLSFGKTRISLLAAVFFAITVYISGFTIFAASVVVKSPRPGASRYIAKVAPVAFLVGANADL
jgi:hypothetical protein